VKLEESTIEANKRFFAKKEDVPRYAYTMGVGTIMRAGKVVMVVSGSSKAGIVKEAFFGKVRPEVPASILQFHPDCTVVLDRDAAEQIRDLI
jgi:glucosamine-6-phosphate deaminase